MKFHVFLSVAALCATVFFGACKNDTAATKDAAGDTAATQTAAGAPTTDPAAAPGASVIAPIPGADVSAVAPAPDAKKTEPPQNAAGVWHYTCSKGCAGGAGAAVACAKCGTTLAHNTAYHATATTPAGADKTTVAPKPEPAQNKAGVWHYTCSDGCPGGAGAAAACAKCGKTLAHNSAYHQ